MADRDYTTFYLKELLPMIDRIALEAQKDPNPIIMSKDDMTMIAWQNANVALHNQGVMKMRAALIEALNKEADPGG